MLSTNNNHWYKHGWGLVIAILFFPIFIIWFAWKRTNWSKGLKIGVTTVSSIFVLIVAMNMNASSANTTKSPPITQPSTSQKAQSTQYKVVKVIDGDTIDVEHSGITERIRFIGIDSPEKNDPRKTVECFANEASSNLKLLISGKSVELETDPSQGNLDKYKRLLRYVWLNGTNINKKMIEDGYAYEYTYGSPYKYQSEFKAAQTEAKNASNGLWATDTCSGQRKKPKPAQPEPTTPSTSSEPEPQQPNCNPNYSPCVPNSSSDLDCGDIGFRVTVIGTDVYRLDRDGDGIGCDSY